ncbi:hypothetical protein [Micromonospora echinofusca]|nr:hypothetical protein [Micromonospora echinofusca]
MTVVGLGAEPGVDDVRQVGVLARAAGGDVALGLPAGWSVLDLGQA